MKLYHHPFSQHSRRVRVLAEELGIELSLIAVDMSRGDHQKPEFLRLNPSGSVPVLVDGDFTLPESHAIMKYLIDQKGGSTLYPKEPKRRAQVDRWLDWTHTRLNPPLEQIAIQLLFMGDKADKQLVGKQRELAESRLAILEVALERRLGIGEDVTIADLAAATTLALHETCGGNFAKYPAISAWYEKMKARASFAATAPKMQAG
jgi:glutathione S-transferase